MPYATNTDLPPAIRRNLPQHAQDIYRAAFNHAFERYGPEHEEVAHRIAWAAVKRSYVHCAAGVWRPREVPARRRARPAHRHGTTDRR